MILVILGMNDHPDFQKYFSKIKSRYLIKLSEGLNKIPQHFEWFFFIYDTTTTPENYR
jgi:hypothetical protein